MCSPFLGGASLELHLASVRKIKVSGFDLFEPLVWFWQSALQSPSATAKEADNFREFNEDFFKVVKSKKVKLKGLTKDRFIDLRSELREAESYSIRNSAIFYALNRSSFSGETLSGGYSKRASYARFTDSSIDRLKNFSCKNLKVESKCFTESIPSNMDSFLYCDPPYMLKAGNNLYGDKGNLHKGFGHEALYDLLDSHPGWVLSYNDCEQVRHMYSKYQIIEESWSYGMKNVRNKKQGEAKVKMGTSSEILIIKE